MTNQEFIEQVAKFVQKYAAQYGIKVHSPIIAQAILESGWGNSKLAARYHNYFGLKCGTKWTGKSVNMTTQEEYTVGTLTTIKDNFRVYDSMEEGIKGYFEFIQLARYQNLKGITDPKKYLETIKADGYATSSTYVTNNMKLIEQHNLMKYDKGVTEMSKAETAIKWMEDTAKDDRHGYCQTHRWGEDGDYDCSSAVYTAWEHAGIPVKTYSFEKYGCAYTGVMLAVFKHFGFEDVTNKVNLATGTGLKRSDILLNDKHHVAMYCGNGMEVEASINEKGTATGGTPGDQTGKEFLIRAYRNYPWNHVLRYINDATESKNYLEKGDSGNGVKEMQKMLIGCGFSCGKSGADGSFGKDTEKALFSFQKSYDLEQDGKYGDKSKAKLISVYNEKVAVPEKKATPSYIMGKSYTLQVELKVRTGSGTNYPAKKHSQLTVDGQKYDKDRDGCLDAGTKVTCQKIQNVGDDIWMKVPSGWIAAYYKGEKFVQ